MARKQYIDDEPEKKLSPWRSLWSILTIVIIDVIVVIGAMVVDSKIFPNEPGQGHPFPAVTMAALIVMGAVTVIVIIVALIKLIVRLARASKDK